MNQDTNILAIKMGTLPKFIQKEGKKSIDILEYIKNTRENLSKVIKNIKIIKPQEIALLFLAYNTKYENTLKTVSGQGMNVETFVQQTLSKSNIDFKKVNLEEAKKYKTKIEKQIKKLKEKNDAVQKYKIDMGPIVKEAIEIIATYNIQNLDSIFNQICLKDSTIPFAVYEREKVFFKIYKDFSPKEIESVDEIWYNSLLLWAEFVDKTGSQPNYYKFYDKRIFKSIEDFEKEQYLYKWVTSQQKSYKEGSLDFLKMYMLIDFNFPFEKRRVKPKIILKYQNKDDVILNINKEGKLVIKFNSTDNKNRDLILKTVLDLFRTVKLPAPEIKENIVTSSVKIKLDTFYNKYIFLDLVSNNSDFTEHLFVNEFEKVSKSKENTVWVYFKDKTSRNVTISITRSKYDPNIVFLKIKKTSEAKIKNMVKVIENLFKIYSQKKDSIISFYKKYIKDFSDSIKVKQIKAKKGVKILDTELFPKSIYARNCQGKSQPQLNKEEKFDKDRYFEYPLGIKDKAPKRYLCADEERPWPGLINISKKLSEEVNKKHITKGWVPCCYKGKGKPYKNMIKYIESGGDIDSLVVRKKNVKQTSIEETRHFITYGQTKKFNFNLLGQGKFFRKGFAENKSTSNINSFMYCMYYIFKNDYPKLAKLYKSKKYKDLNSFFNEKRNEFSKQSKIISLCKQELYDKTDKEIAELLQSKSYFDPKLFINILSTIFSCNILLFEKRDKKFELVLPNYKEGYYHDNSYGLCVFLYLNYGSISSKNKFPQCEIIGALNENKELETIFDSDSEYEQIKNIYKTANKMFDIITNNIVLNKFDNMLNQNFSVPQMYFESQYFDAYGKSRILTFNYKKSKGTLITSPNQPIEVKKCNECKIFKLDKKKAIDFFKNVLQIKHKFVIENKEAVAITGYLGNITCIVPIISSRKISNLEGIQMEFIIPDKESYIETFNIKRRLAFCLQSYVLWVYSLNRKDLDFLEFDLVNDLKKFEKEYFVIKKNYLVNIRSNGLQLISPILENGKIIVDTVETRKRLIYYLFMNIKNNSKFVKNYYKNIYIPDFYQNIQDFSKYQTEILLEGVISFKNWYNNNELLMYYNSIEPESEESYIFRNSNIDNHTYIAINTDDWEKAVAIVDFWNKYKYVPEEVDISVQDNSDKGFDLYLYESENDIEKIDVNGGNKNVKICGYKVKGNPMFTSLLKI